MEESRDYFKKLPKDPLAIPLGEAINIVVTYEMTVSRNQRLDRDRLWNLYKNIFKKKTSMNGLKTLSSTLNYSFPIILR